LNSQHTMQRTLFMGLSPIPHELKPLFESASKHSDPMKRFRLYAVLAKFRRHGSFILHSNDPDVRAVRKMALQVDREIARVLRSLRFTRYSVETAEFLEAWCEPRHAVLEDLGRFFQIQMPKVRWVLRTPDGAATWDLKELSIIQGTLTKDAPMATNSLAS